MPKQGAERGPKEVTVQEVASTFGVSRTTIYGWLEKRRLADLTIKAVIELAKQMGREEAKAEMRALLDKEDD